MLCVVMIIYGGFFVDWIGLINILYINDRKYLKDICINFDYIEFFCFMIVSMVS